MAEGKKILSELFEKASELSSFLSGSSAGGGSNSSACGRNGGSAAASEIVHGSSGGTSGTRNYMPSFRRQFLNGGRPRSKRSKGQGKNIASGPFMRDVILLTSPDINTVPRQGNRVWLMENGYVISGFQMHKEWSECQVVASLIEAFGDKLPHNVDVEIVMPVHSTLVKPTLPPGQGLNGIMAHRIFKEKPLYLRPSKEICPDILPSRKRPRRFGFEDVDSTCDSSANEPNVEEEPPQMLDFDPPPVLNRDPPLVLNRDPPPALNRDPPLVLNRDPPLVLHRDPPLVLNRNPPQVLNRDNDPPQMFEVNPLPVFEVDEGVTGDAGSRPLKSVTLHRALLKQEMLHLFKDPTILQYDLDITIISHNGHEEEGKGTGVVREVLATFWDQCYNSLTTGALEKVPNVRHDHQRAEWEAIGRIIIYGHSVVGYFPTTLSRAFVATVFFGEESLTPDFLIESFKLYVSSEERAVLDKSLGHECNPNDEDLLDFLSSFKCYKCPTKDSIKTIMHELAHQEIVQKPRYIVDCLTPIFNALRAHPHFQTFEALVNFYNEKKPSSKKIVKLLSASPESAAQQSSLDHLKRYVRNLEGNALGNFLQFLTGSDIIVCDSISVTFTQLDGMTRRPVAHTCGPLLELPSTYQSYNELAEELTSILRDKQAWSFNIV